MLKTCFPDRRIKDSLQTKSDVSLVELQSVRTQKEVKCARTIVSFPDLLEVSKDTLAWAESAKGLLQVIQASADLSGLLC